jgi:hypothetical protein
MLQGVAWSDELIDDEMFYQDLHRSNPKDYPEATLLENNPDFYKEEDNIKKTESK